MQNRLSDLHMLIKFLRVQFFEKDDIWFQYILQPMMNNHPDNLRLLLRWLMLRRTKDEHLKDILPSCKHITILLPMNPQAETVYSRAYEKFVDNYGVNGAKKARGDCAGYFSALRDLRIGSNHPLQFDRPFLPQDTSRPEIREVSPMERALRCRNPDTGPPNDALIRRATEADWILSPKLKFLTMSLKERRRPGEPFRKSVVYTQWTSSAEWYVYPLIIRKCPPPPHS